MSSFGNLNSFSTTGATTGGVLAQVIATGAADTHLTGKPTKTYWRSKVARCTNFATESILQTFTGEPSWGSQVSLKLNRTGDLVSNMYVVLDIPGITAVSAASGEASVVQQFPVTGSGDDHMQDHEAADDDSGVEGPYCNWVNAIGHAAIARASFAIGGQIIDTVYNHYMNMWEELAGQPGKRLEEMIGKRYSRRDLVLDSSKDRRLYIPIPWSFTKNSESALSLVTLSHHSVDVHIAFSPLTEMIQVSSRDVKVVRTRDGQPVGNSDMNAMLDTTYVYLDVEERDRFHSGQFQQLIQQVQQYSATTRNGSLSASLNFNHPTIELMWCCQRKSKAVSNDHFDYSGSGANDPLVRASLRLNNLVRFDREAPYFRLVQPFERHTNVPRSFIYVYSFALEPESDQPSGSLNMSRIDSVQLNMSLQESLSGEECAVYVFARNWNVLRYKDGLGGVLYSN